ncbi:MAG: LLM class flavin-dependent oxidoreductase, partial [Solirubrobacterales bacterium]|nr:LLM class flavin-dependent oxidoreductase [Solirubrobacterales bacterium]
CPMFRYHPAIVAQKAATVQILSGGRFRLGLGAGENLNEHVVGKAWPPVACATRCSPKRSTSSPRCSTPPRARSTTAANTSMSNRRASGICPSNGFRSGSRCRVRTHAAWPVARPI